MLSIGTAITDMFPCIIELYCMTVLMSVGFHDYVAFLTSLALQWGDKAPAPETLGQLIQVKAAASIVTYSGVWLVFDFFGGSAALALVVFCIVAYSRFPERVVQNKNLALLSRYRLYSALTFMLGIQCQIFIIFARFLIVEKFGYSVSAIATLYLLNATAGMALNVPHNPSRGNEVIVGRAGAAIPAETAPRYVSLGLDFQARFPT
ncbi:hypothetical protein OAS67_05315 [Alphaproteobacteria bacterium]|nr:hypothetical protein [Alphaproteobacteria bacterium]